MATAISDIEEIKRLKTEGNGYFIQKDYHTAIEYYTKGIDHTIYDSATADDNESLIELRQSLLLNRAKCHFQLKNLKDALIDSSRCIQTSDGSKLSYKAHYTRSEIYLHLNDYKSAIMHCDRILKAPSHLVLTSLQQRSKKLKRQIKEKCVASTLKQSKQHRSRRANNIVNAMTLTMGEHRARVELLQKQMDHTDNTDNTNTNNTKDDIGLLVSCKWWNKWYKLDANKRLNEVDIGILMVNNSDLIEPSAPSQDKENENEKEEDEKKEDNNIIDIASPYFTNNLRENLSCGAPDGDYLILSFKSYQEMTQMGYKLQPTIWVKRIDDGESSRSWRYEVYKSKFEIHFGDRVVVSLLCSMNTTIRKLCTEIARHFVIQSSSIRLRYENTILDGSHTLAQHQVANNSRILVESRLPNGCWPYRKETVSVSAPPPPPDVICQSCQRLITHYIDCPRAPQCNAKYCNNKHLAAHWKYHEAEHRMHMKSNNLYHGRWGLCGLQNLGNTCYINSSLQCLSFIAELRCYLTSDDYAQDVNRENALGFGGELATICAAFFKKMWFGLSEVVYPTEMRRTIGRLHSEWSSREQQDAEEFIRWLLDGLHEDLNLIKRKPYYVLPDSGNRNECVVANEHWTLHLKRNQSIIVDMFQGQYKSTLQCPQSQCAHTSLKFDAFSALTLPIPDKETQIAVQCLVFSSCADSCTDASDYYKPYELTVNVSAKAVVTQLTANLREKMGAKYLEKSRELLVCRVAHCKFGKYWSQSRPVKKVIHRSPILYVYQVSSTTIAQRKQNDLVQIRMNFCYKHRMHPESASSGDSSSNDEYNNQNNENNIASNHRLCFAHPIVMDMKCSEFTGAAMYKIFMKRFECISHSNSRAQGVVPAIEMFIKKENGDESSIEMNSDSMISVSEWTNRQRNVATINVELSETEYKLYIDQRAAIASFSSSDLGLSSDDSGAIKKYIDIYDCLKLYTAAEVLDDVVWKCAKCHKEGQPSKQLHLWRLPQILIIHLKRFINQTGYFGGIGKKNSANVVAPINGLDLTEYCTKLCDTDSALEIPKYDLFATLNHHGIMEFGHYYSCVRTDHTTQITNYYQYHEENREKEKEKETATWRLFNDEKIHKISIEQLKQYSKDAYLLFYRRRDTV